MAKLKLTKSSLKRELDLLGLYERILPSLDLKRRQLMVELQRARLQSHEARRRAEELEVEIGRTLPMLADAGAGLEGLVRVRDVSLGRQNVVGVELPTFEAVGFDVARYSDLAAPVWLDIAVRRLEQDAEQRLLVQVEAERVRRLERAARRVQQRINLFEKVLIPAARKNVRRIRIFLGDVQRAAVVRSKIAKSRRRRPRDDGEGRAA